MPIDRGFRLGILGGMGPAATASFYSELVARTPVGRDQDHIPVVLWADPTVPDRSAALLDGGTPVEPWLERGIDALLTGGATIIACPCNTAHAWLPMIAEGRNARLLDIVEVTTRAIQKRGLANVGVLATDATIHANLYQTKLNDLQVQWTVPDPRTQKQVMQAIYRVKTGTTEGLDDARVQMLDVVRRLEEAGVDGVVTACTELGLVLDDRTNDVPQVDSVAELAQAVVDAFVGPSAVRAHLD